MFQYTNSYSCAIANDNSTVILHFSQRLPSVAAGELGERETTPIASVIMDTDVAAELGKALCELTDKSAPDDGVDAGQAAASP